MPIKNNQGSDNIPLLRFPEFEGDWEKKKLGEIFSISAGGDIESKNVSQVKTDVFKYPIYANAEKDKGFYGYSDIYKVEENVLTVAGRGVNIGIAHARNHKFYPIVRLLVLKPLNNENIYFFENEINRLELFKESTGVPQLTAPQISGYEVCFPSLPEQTKIASFLTAVDEKIQALKKKHSLLEQYKKGVMQKLFSQALRFKDEDGNDFPDWSPKKIGDSLDYEQPTNYLVSSTEYSDKHSTPVVTAGKTFILGYTDETSGIFSNGLPVIIFDDFTTASQFVDFPFKAKSSAMKILKSKENTDIKFMYEALQMVNYEIGAHGRHWISVFAEMEILTPDYKEQIKISSFLSAIDKKINSVNTLLLQTENWKKGLLQKMFC